MLSFALDKHWQHHNVHIEFQNKITEENKHSLRGRQDTFRPKDEYNFINYLGYINYLPLFLAGPIINFNAWIS